MNGDDMPDGLVFPDQVMFLALRSLYDQFKRRVIDRDTATAEKKKLIDQYEDHRRKWHMADNLYQIIRRTELARAEYRKNPTRENADRLAAAIEGGK